MRMVMVTAASPEASDSGSSSHEVPDNLEHPQQEVNEHHAEPLLLRRETSLGTTGVCQKPAPAGLALTRHLLPTPNTQPQLCA